MLSPGMGDLLQICCKSVANQGWHSCCKSVANLLQIKDGTHVITRNGGPPREGVSVDFDSQGGVAKLVKGGAQLTTMIGDFRGRGVLYP